MNEKERIWMLEGKVAELERKLKETAKENSYLRIKAMHDSGARDIIIGSITEENEKLTKQVAEQQSRIEELEGDD